MTKRRLCILSFSDLNWDRRVTRQIEAARHTWQVDVIAYGDWQPPEGVVFHKLERHILKGLQKYPWLIAGRVAPSFYERYLWSNRNYRDAYKILVREKFDLIHANDWDGQPVAVRAARECGSKVLLDAHEFSPAQAAGFRFGKQLIVPYREYLLLTYQQPIAHKITVNHSIAALYQKMLGWQMDVIMNAPSFTPVNFKPTEPSKIRLVHHGIAASGRKLEEMICLFKYLPDQFELHFFLLSNEKKYLDKIKNIAYEVAKDQIQFHAPIPPKDMIAELSNYDIGIPWLDEKNTNHFYALPNKFFDFAMSGLAVAVAPFPEMEYLVNQYQMGVVADDFSVKAMADALRDLTLEQINLYKKNALQFAQTYNAEKEMQKLLGYYEKCMEFK